jgi:hypothetical protein
MDNPFKGLSRNAKIAVAIGGAATAWLAWKQHKASTASPSASSIDPVTGLPYSQDNATDPLTGQAYLAEAQAYGSVAAAEQAFAASSSVDYSSAYGSSGSGDGGQALVPANTVQGTTYATNAAWAQAVEAGLTDIGYTSTDIAAALGRYLGSLPETADQATIVGAAIAEYGPPPVGTYQVILAPATGSTGSGSTGTGTSTDTGTGTGSTGAGTGRLAAPSGVVLTGGKTGVKFTWQPVPGATGYVCQLKKGGENGATQNGPFTVTSPVCNFGGLTALTQYTAFIWPSDAADQGGPGSSQPHYQHTFTTT